MRLFKSRVWSFWDIGTLKIYGFVVGLIIGAYIAAVVKEHLWLFVLAALALMVRLTWVVYYQKDRQKDEHLDSVSKAQ